MLLPDDVDEYGGYRAYFMSRRKWFFAILACAFAVDVVDSWIKGAEHLRPTRCDVGRNSGHFKTRVWPLVTGWPDLDG